MVRSKVSEIAQYDRIRTTGIEFRVSRRPDQGGVTAMARSHDCDACRVGMALGHRPATPTRQGDEHSASSDGCWQKCGPLGQSQSCTSRTYQHLWPAVLTTGGAGCSSVTREKPYPSTCH